MTRVFTWKLVVLFAFAATQVISAQTAGAQPFGTHSTPLPDIHFNANAAPRTSATTGPGIIAIGSPLYWDPTNAPDTYTATTTFSSTPVLVDNGQVKLWQEQTPTGPNSEWDLFYMETTNGGPLANNVNSLWQILFNYTLTQAADFDQVIQQWWVNGTAVGP